MRRCRRCFGVVVASAGLAWLVVCAAQVRADQRALNGAGEPAQPRVVVENACAWPNLTVLPGGEIAAIIFNQPSHGRMVGELDCYVTADGGATWEKRASPVTHEPGTMTNRMNHAAGLAANGDLVVISSGWTLIDKPVEIHGSQYDVDRVLDPVICRSTDAGRTWSVTHGAFPAIGPDGGELIPYGDVITDPRGVLRVTAYATTDKQTKTRRAYVLESHDDGGTWSDPVVIDAAQNMTETFIQRLDDGRWLAAARHANLLLYESDDARTWRPLGPATENNEIPGHLFQLADGRLLLCAGRRVKGDEGVVARISADGGRTWSAPARLADFIGFDGGYPSSVQLPDGRVLTAYYAKKTEAHDGYHMGQVVWDVDRTFGRGE